VWVVFWGLYRHSRLIQRVQRATYRGLRAPVGGGMLTELLAQARAPQRRRPRRSSRVARPTCGSPPSDSPRCWMPVARMVPEPGAFRPAEAVALCEAWVESLCRRAGRS